LGGPDAPSNIFPAPRGINLQAMAAIEKDLRDMAATDQEVYVQVYERYDRSEQRIPMDITYRIYRKFEGSWRLLTDKAIVVTH
jgi:hypothetical protein